MVDYIRFTRFYWQRSGKLNKVITNFRWMQNLLTREFLLALGIFAALDKSLPSPLIRLLSSTWSSLLSLKCKILSIFDIIVSEGGQWRQCAPVVKCVMKTISYRCGPANGQGQGDQ